MSTTFVRILNTIIITHHYRHHHNHHNHHNHHHNFYDHRSRQLVVFMLIGLLASLTIDAASAQDTFDPSVLCSLLPNDAKLKDSRSCNTWIQCINGQPISSVCPDGLFYDRSTQQCRPSSLVKCISSDPCASTAGTNGFVSDPYSCNAYYYCNNGSAAKGYCNNGMNFNPGTQDCIRNFPCTPKINPNNLCNILADGVIIKNPTNCNGWQECWKGDIVNGTCPGSFYYDASTGVCDYPENVECLSVTASDPPAQSGVGICSTIGEFVSDNSTCDGYYYCHGVDGGEIILQHGVCPDGRFFNAADGGSCIDRTQIACVYNRCEGLGADTVQLANRYNDNCTGFSVCQDGEAIGSGTCPNGEYFDELTQRCTTEVITYPACAISSATSQSTSG